MFHLKAKVVFTSSGADAAVEPQFRLEDHALRNPLASTNFK
jgi:hypothetical protein